MSKYLLEIGVEELPYVIIPTFISQLKTNFEKLEIPLPPLDEQERIVRILDSLNELANGLSAGIPKEIELRQKQYEYWRDRLLEFPSKDSKW